MMKTRTIRKLPSRARTGDWRRSKAKRAILQRCPVTGKVIKKFAKWTDAVDAILEANPDRANRHSVESQLSSVLHGNRKTCSGFVYAYENDPIRGVPDTKRRTGTRNRTIEQRCPLTGKVLNRFASHKDAVDAILEANPDRASRNSVVGQLSRVLRGKEKMCSGFVYAYQNDPIRIASNTQRRNDTKGRTIEQRCPLTGKVLKRFASWKDTVDAILEANPDRSNRKTVGSQLSSVLHGNVKTCSGFVYAYENDAKRVVVSNDRRCSNNSMKNCEVIEQRCPITGRLIERFASRQDTVDAILEANPDRTSRNSVVSQLARVLRGKEKTCSGFAYASYGKTAAVSKGARRSKSCIPTTGENRPIERRCPVTGEVLERFNSRRDVVLAIQKAHPHKRKNTIEVGLHRVLNQGRKTCYGFAYTYEKATAAATAASITARRRTPKVSHRPNIAHTTLKRKRRKVKNNITTRRPCTKVIRQVFTNDEGEEQSCVYMHKRTAAQDLANKHDIPQSKATLDSLEEGISDVLSGKQDTFMHCQFRFVDFFR